MEIAKLKKPALLMIVGNAFPNDTRVRKEADVLRELYDITVIALKKCVDKYCEQVNGMSVIRIPDLSARSLDLRNKFLRCIFNRLFYVLEYVYFTTAATVIFLATVMTRKYKVIHVHNPPDTLFLIGLIGKLLSIRFIYDHHDLSPELYLSRFSGRRDLIYRTLVLF